MSLLAYDSGNVEQREIEADDDEEDHQPHQEHECRLQHADGALAHNIVAVLTVLRDILGATGEITGGSASGCVFTGTLRPRPSGKNVYDLSLTYGGGGCWLGSGTATGIGLIGGIVDTGSFDPPSLGLTLVAEKNDRTGGLWGQAYRAYSALAP